MEFRLTLSRDQIHALAMRYKENESDDRALAAGKVVLAGKGDRKQLKTIFEWKTRNRGKSRLLRNSDEEIVDAFHGILAVRSDRIRLGVLCALGGVDVPVASAILSMVWPKDYLVIDFRALETLGVGKYTATIPYYLKYLDFCRHASEKLGVDLWTLDKALWQHSKEKSQS